MKRQSAIALMLTCLLAVNSFGEDKDDRPAELKVLDRLVGTWDAETVSKPAEWTPKEVRSKSELTRKWVLKNQFVREVGRSWDGQQTLLMWSYDSQKKAYRYWFFTSQGNTHEATGRWDKQAKTLTMKTDIGNGVTSTGRVRFVDENTHVWTAIAKNREGKVFFHMEGKVTRKK